MSALSGTAKRAAARLLSSLPALLGVLVFTFLLMRVLTSDYASEAAVLEPARRSLACTPAAQ